MMDWLRKDDLVFDVGAHVGDKTAVYRAAGCRVVAFEPEPVSFAKLHHRFRDDRDVTAVNVGLASRMGGMTLFICTDPRCRTLSTFAPHWKTGRFAGHHWGESVEVDVITLDRAIQVYGRPGFIKIDVEGYELEVLRGLSQPPPALCFEFAGEFPDITALSLLRLTELGYQRFGVAFGKADKPEQWAADTDAVLRCLGAHGSSAWGDIYAFGGGTCSPTN